MVVPRKACRRVAADILGWTGIEDTWKRRVVALIGWGARLRFELARAAMERNVGFQFLF